MSLRNDFVAEIRAFLVSSRMDATTFGREVMNDPNFVFEVERGRSVRVDTIEKVRRFMADHRAGMSHRASEHGSAKRAAG